MTLGRKAQMPLAFGENNLWNELSPEVRNQCVQLFAQLLREILQAERKGKEICHE